MKVLPINSHFTAEEVQTMTYQMVNLLQERHRQFGNQGEALGVFPMVGRGDGSLDDSYRLAEPGDNLKDYHLPLNSLQPKGGPYYVWTRPNRYQRHGLIVPDIMGSHQPGGDQAIYEREELAAITTELLLRVAFELGDEPGLMLQQINSQIRVLDAGTDEGQLLHQLMLAREQTAQTDRPKRLLTRLWTQMMRSRASSAPLGQLTGFETCLDHLKVMSTDLDFAIVISDLLSNDWETRLTQISQSLELVVFQIIDPWDLELPNLGRRKFFQGGRKVIVNTHKPEVRAAYQAKAQEQQARIAEVLQAAKAQHYKLTTARPLFDQLMQIFESESGIQQAA